MSQHESISGADGKMTIVSVCLPEPLVRRVHQQAVSERRSVSAILRHLVEDHIPPRDDPAAGEARPWP
jgi:hypothetical protein